MVTENAPLQADVHHIIDVLGERKLHSNGQMTCLRMRNLNYHPWTYKLIGWLTLVWYALCSHGLISYEIWKTESKGELDIFYDTGYDWHNTFSRVIYFVLINICQYLCTQSILSWVHCILCQTTLIVSTFISSSVLRPCLWFEYAHSIGNGISTQSPNSDNIHYVRSTSILSIFLGKYPHKLAHICCRYKFVIS